MKPLRKAGNESLYVGDVLAGIIAVRDDETSGTVTADGTNAERAAPAQASTNDDRGYQRAETRTREEYADDMRAGRRADEHQGTAATAADRDQSPDSSGHRADQASEDHAPAWQPAGEAPTLADADLGGTSDGPAETELARSGEQPAGDQPGGRIADADQTATSAQEQQGAGHRPETITFDNKDIEVTHNAADGIWIEGLPGDPPTRIGDILSSPEKGEQSRIESLSEELTKDADDLIDMGGKWTDLLRDTLGPPQPTNSMTHSRLPDITAARPEHGIDAGHGAEAVLTVAIVGAAAIHKLHERWQRAWEH
jgi:hypothetical protein